MPCSYIYEYGTNGSDVNIPDPVQRAVRLAFSVLFFAFISFPLQFSFGGCCRQRLEHSDQP